MVTFKKWLIENFTNNVAVFARPIGSNPIRRDGQQLLVEKPEKKKKKKKK